MVRAAAWTVWASDSGRATEAAQGLDKRRPGTAFVLESKVVIFLLSQGLF